MKPTRKQIKSILLKAMYWKKQDDKLQELYNEFNNVFASSSHNPVIENRTLTGYISGVHMLLPELDDDIFYYAYAAQNMDNPTCYFEGKEYNAKDIDSYTDFIMASNRWNS